MIQVECEACGGDCSHAYATHCGYPYHTGCLPIRPKRRETWKDEIDRIEAVIAKDENHG